MEREIQVRRPCSGMKHWWRAPLEKVREFMPCVARRRGRDTLSSFSSSSYT